VYQSEYTQFGDRGDAGKFFNCDKIKGYRLICDDDIIYPSDYVRTMISAVERYKRKCIVGVHAIKLKDEVKDYYNDRWTFHMRDGLSSDRAVHLFGTNTVAYHTDTIELLPEHFPEANMADIWLYVQTQKQKVGCVTVAREDNWVTDCPNYDQKDTIYHKNKKKLPGNNCELQTRVANSIVNPVLYSHDLVQEIRNG